MILTKSNVLTTAPSVTSGSSTDLPSSIINQDFSLNYTSSSKTGLTIEFGSTVSIDYVAVAGIILKGNSAGASKVQLFDSTTLIKEVFISRNNVIVFNFDAQTFTNLKVVLSNPTGDIEPTVSYIAAGNTVTVPNSGETSGHSRSWLNRKFKTKTTVSNNSAPVAALRKTVVENGRLSIPNALTTFCEGDMQVFLDFAEDNLFFINEDATKPQSSYCCSELFSATFKAHSDTRSLNNISLSFKVYRGV